MAAHYNHGTKVNPKVHDWRTSRGGTYGAAAAGGRGSGGDRRGVAASIAGRGASNGDAGGPAAEVSLGGDDHVVVLA